MRQLSTEKKPLRARRIREPPNFSSSSTCTCQWSPSVQKENSGLLQLSTDRRHGLFSIDRRKYVCSPHGGTSNGRRLEKVKPADDRGRGATRSAHLARLLTLPKSTSAFGPTSSGLDVGGRRLNTFAAFRCAAADLELAATSESDAAGV